MMGIGEPKYVKRKKLKHLIRDAHTGFDSVKDNIGLSFLAHTNAQIAVAEQALQNAEANGDSEVMITRYIYDTLKTYAAKAQ